MAFDQTTRNRLQQFVGEVRSLLSDEFTRQLQATYGMNPETGELANISTLTGLTPSQQETAHLLRDTLEHYLTNTEKARKSAAIERIVREQSFTVLNRLAALRMSEARGFLIESLAEGYDSKGFQLFHRLAGSSLGETGEAYQHYLYSLFDEFSLDLAVLFDRFSVQGRLFPMTPVLLKLLDLINDEEISLLWAEDETIGWIYQYFNSIEERKKMRAESQAPRNSRELAVRNQFFTPRYVVEFLTDNTLGRIWYEMTQGKTDIVQSCKYLVRRPNELFLAEGEVAPEQEENLELSQTELLQQTVYIQYRAIKDPRDIRMLDPACGSMHFGLYAFDLFEAIYSEAWDIEIAQGTEALIRENGKTPITTEYEDKDAFLLEVPRLIIENNIHGVDIDPRAAQIAGLSLWLRAHNSWQKAGIKPQQRPKIQRSNIVCAEPMPGEKALLQEFTATLKPTVLGQLVEIIFEKMELAGEAGTLLKIEQEIQDAIAKAKQVWQKQNQALGQFPDLAKVAKQRGETAFDISDIDGEGFWEQAEQKILQALADYAQNTVTDVSGQKRLFAEDVVKGFSFIDLCQKKFDVILMNPPYGDVSEKSFDYVKTRYPGLSNNIYSCFYLRALDLSNNGKIGSLTSRTFLTLSQFEKLRKILLSDRCNISELADLGPGILDGAAVDTCACIIDVNVTSKYGDYFRVDDLASKRQRELLSLVRGEGLERHYKVDNSKFKSMPQSRMMYSAPIELYELFSKHDDFEGGIGEVRPGCLTGDDFRFLRCWWELPIASNKWYQFSKGGDYQRYYSDIPMYVNWHDDGAEVKAFAFQKVGSVSKWIFNESYYFREGATFPNSSALGYSARYMPAGCIISVKGQGVFPCGKNRNDWVLTLLNSTLAHVLLFLFNPGKDVQAGDVKKLPFMTQNGEFPVIANDLVRRIVELAIYMSSFLETSQKFSRLIDDEGDFKTQIENAIYEINEIENRLDMIVNDHLAITQKTIDFLVGQTKSRPSTEEQYRHSLSSLFEDNFIEKAKLSFLFGCAFGRWNINELSSTDFCLSDKYEHATTRDSKLVDSNTEKSSEVIELDSYFNNTTDVMEVLANATFLVKENFSTDELHSYFVKPNMFFDTHLSAYTSGRRKAPIYWPLQTESASYTLWVYYHNLNKQTLFVCVNDFIEPKLALISEALTFLRNNSLRSQDEEKEFGRLTDLKLELEIFRDELLRITKFWKPNLNDGVQITAAPLWRLFQHKAWQKKLKQIWGKLEAGDYDWAHLAYSIWPTRVLKKCHQDRSLAIAHDVENDLWHEVEVIKPRKKEPVLEWQPKPLSDTELNTYIKNKIQTEGLGE